MSLKENLYATCINLIEDKIAAIETELHSLTEGAGNEIKSSAGDKHETARAMMQQEHEKLSRQLQEVLMQKKMLQRIDTSVLHERINKGSLVKTQSGYLFVAVAIGKIAVNDVSVMVLSPESPLGMKLLGLAVNDVVVLNGVNYVIEEVS